MRGVVVERLFLAARGIEAVHVVDEMWEDDLRVSQVGHPFRLPLEGDKAVIVDGGQRLHHAADGQRALADEVIAAVVVRVAQVNVADVGTEVFDGRVGGFAVVPVGMVHIPERAQLVAGKRIEQRAQPGRVGKDAAGLEQDRDPLRLGGGRSASSAAEIRASSSRCAVTETYGHCTSCASCTRAVTVSVQSSPAMSQAVSKHGMHRSFCQSSRAVAAAV